MKWMESTREKRYDPSQVVPGVRTVIALALNYYTPHQHSSDLTTGKISRYAWGDDYHDIVGKMLGELWSWMQTEFPGIGGRYYVDTGPVMEKVWAQQAGIGWIGKHTNVITQDMGSWVFLATILTTLEIEPDPPATDHCGTCTLCISACPTGAITEPYVVDSNRCISYLTIEHRGPFAANLPLDGWIYGCDVCQDVCPWNERFASESAQIELQPRAENFSPQLEEWAGMSETEFSTRFRGSPIKRAKREGLTRNTRAVLAQRAGE
jgi:epoxyqueuosine reductase